MIKRNLSNLTIQCQQAYLIYCSRIILLVQFLAVIEKQNTLSKSPTSTNRIENVTNIKSGADIAKHDYTYDANGNRLTMIESNIHIDQLITYGYDNADRLTSVEYPNNEKTEYVLDKVGNRDEEIITGTAPNRKTYSYNDRDQLTGITDTLGSSISYSYDDAGNQLTKDDNGITTTFDYTARHRVKAITLGAQQPINYQYDYTGQRVNYQRNGIEKRYLYDGLALVAETNTIGNTIAKYVYGDRYQLAEQRNTINSYYHVDSLGTNVAVTNQDGSIQARYEYDAFGEVDYQLGSIENNYLFTGEQYDNNVGFYYLRARFYNPGNGRFLNLDTFAGHMHEPKSLHKYLYTGNNPVDFIDPSGNSFFSLLGGIVNRVRYATPALSRKVIKFVRKKKVFTVFRYIMKKPYYHRYMFLAKKGTKTGFRYDVGAPGGWGAVRENNFRPVPGHVNRASVVNGISSDGHKLLGKRKKITHLTFLQGVLWNSIVHGNYSPGTDGNIPIDYCVAGTNCVTWTWFATKLAKSISKIKSF